MTREEALAYVEESARNGELGYEPDLGLIAVFLWANEEERLAAEALGLRTAEVPRHLWSEPYQRYHTIRAEFLAALITGEACVYDTES